MFCGKSEELIRLCNREGYAKRKVQAFKPIIDARYGLEKISSHIGRSIEATPVKEATEIPALIEAGTSVVAIDEAQFFTPDIVGVCDALANRKLRVLVAGLDLDAWGKGFGPVPLLMAIADRVVKLSAICTVCGKSAIRSQRISANRDQILVGAKSDYESRCRLHFSPPEVV
jgi:thymidine kinase